MESLALTFLTSVGLGLLLPWPRSASHGSWIGLRLQLGFCIMIAALFALHLVFRLPLQVAAWGTAAMASVGLLRMRRLTDWSGMLSHPAMVLPLFILLDLSIRGLDYTPLAWDELSNWLSWTRQSVATGRLLGADIHHGVPGYTPGWPLALAYPSLLVGGFRFNHAALVPFVMHVAMLGLLFDVMVSALLRRGTALVWARIGAWGILLLVLAVEASWKLVPTHLLIEEPQSYLLLAWLMIAWLMLDGYLGQRTGAFCLGIIFLGGYLIKVAMLAFGPAALVVLLWQWWRRRADPQGAPLPVLLLLAFGPAMVAYGVWRVTGWYPGCMGEPLLVFRSFLAGAVSPERAYDLFSRLFGWILGYLGTYKLPLTVMGGGALVMLSRWNSSRPMVVAYVVYLAAYFGSLYVYHLDCLGEYYFETLNSPDRFTRVPLRLMHVAGIVVPAIPLVALAFQYSFVRRLAAALVVFLAAWQVWRSDGAVRAMTTRWDASPEQVSEVARMRHDAETVAGLVADRPELGQQVRIIAQGSAGYPKLILSFFGEGRFTVTGAFSWGELPANTWMVKADAAGVLADLGSASLIWPVQVDAWMVDILRSHLDDPHCADNLEGHYMLSRPDGRFSCFPKP